MSMHKHIHQHFQAAVDRFNTCEGMSRFWRGELTREHYAVLMREVFHHTRENPQIQASATAFFRGRQRNMVKPFLRHAIAEVGHDEMALADAKAAGYDTRFERESVGLPATTALVAFAYYQIFNLNPVGYLGYLYFLEYMPTSFGERYLARLTDMGVTPDAMTFLQHHTVVDVAHNRFMEEYVEELVTSADDAKAVTYAIDVTASLYSAMVTDAFSDADPQSERRRSTELAAVAP